MCEYSKENKCTINNKICPFIYFCEASGVWKDSKYMPTDCKVKKDKKLPKGYYRVADVRKGCLYISVNGQIVKIENPFENAPKFVKLRKTKNGYQIRK